jgi:mannitol-1-phosphate/altronate dehydrogenase
MEALYMVMESIKLNERNLSGLKAPISVPGYDRSKLSPSIVHIGLGHFHRAHQAVYLEELLNRGLADSGIFEMNIVSDSFPLAEVLGSQDHLYTLITKSAKGETTVRIVGAILEYLNSYGDKQKGIARLADDATKLITLTVTEKGYYYDPKNGEPDRNEAAVRNDLENPASPQTAAGFLAAALALRYKNGRKPLTIMCCDNIPANGKLVSSCVKSFCRELYPEIVSWIEDNVSFPCSMVDRITPGTTPELIKELEERYGIVDGWPVCGEDYIQWVLEDNFKTAVPDYAASGVQIVRDVEPYELMKMRLLNGSHAALAFPSYLMGCRMVDEGITNPLIGDFIRNHYMEETTPTLEPVPGIDLNVYKDTLVSRFSNKNIGDTILRLASFGSSKLPNFTLKGMSQAIRAHLPHNSFVFAVACWARYLSGTDEEGRVIPIEDDNAAVICEAPKKATQDPKNFLKVVGVLNLNENEFDDLAAKFKEYLDQIYTQGTKTALAAFLKK